MPEAPAGQNLLALDELARYEAFLALYRSEDPAARRELRDFLGGANPLLKIALLEYLQEIPERRALRLALPLLEDPNPAVRRSAAAAYRRNHLNSKNRLLRPFVASAHPEARRFAIRTLARQGDRDMLATLLRELPSAPEPVQDEILAALRLLAEPASVPALLQFAVSPREPQRHLAVLALGELRGRGEALPPDCFLARLQDPSDRVRRAALAALQHYPSRRITQLFLDQALDPKEERRHRRRAIEALASFPQADWIKPLVGLVLEGSDGELRLASEIALKRFPPALLKTGLGALLDDASRPLALQAALLLAETLGDDPEVRARILGLWNAWTDLDSRLQLLEALRDLDDEAVVPLLIGVLKESPVLAYAAIAALNRLWTAQSGTRMLAILKDPALPQHARQALLSALVKRSPAESMRAELLAWILETGLGDPVLNIRYLSLQVLAWYPLAEKDSVLLDQLTRADNEELILTARRQFVNGLGDDPLPLAAAWRRHPHRVALVGHLCAMLASRPWDPRKGQALLEELAREPGSLAAGHPFEFQSLALRFLERGDASFLGLWKLIREKEQRLRFLGLLAAAMKDPARGFPRLPLAALAEELLPAGEAARTLLYELAELGGDETAVGLLTSWLLEESGEAPLLQGRRSLSRLVWKAAPAAP